MRRNPAIALIHFGRAIVQSAVCGLMAGSAIAGVAVQPGVYYHDPDNVELELSNIRSGELCAAEDDGDSVCTTVTKVVVTGQQTCQGNDGSDFPCTRFGYQFDYRGAETGSKIDCTIMRRDPMGRKSSLNYSRPLEAETGRIYLPTYRGFAPVDKRVIMSEVHDCQYQGEKLVNFEFIIYYEPDTVAPGTGAAQTADAYFPEVPNACSAPHLTETRARGLLGAERVKPSAANEHVPKLQSQCIYSAKGGTPGQVGFVYKFMLSDMFDVDKLDPMQVQFNATFATGGAELTQTRNELGDRAFVFLKGDRSTLLVITGIKGPKDFAGRPNEFIANYYLDRSGLTQEERADLLMEQARRDLSTWGESAP